MALPEMFLQLLSIFRDVKLALTFVLGLLITTYLIRKFSRNPRWVELAKKLPGPYALPIFGNSFHFVLGAKDGVEPYLTRCVSKYGPTFRLWIGNHLAVVVSDVDDIETVLQSSSCLGKSELMVTFGKHISGNGLPIAHPVSSWKHKRRAFQPFFTKNHSLPQIPVINQLINKSIDRMKSLVDGPEKDWKHAMDDLSLHIIARLYLTSNDNFEIDELNKIVAGLTAAMEMGAASMMLNSFPLMHIWSQFLPLSLPKLGTTIKHYVDKVVDFNKKEAINSAEEENGDKHQNSASPVSFIEALKRVEKELGGDDSMYADVTAFLIAGLETTGTSIAGCLFVLAVHPEIQQKVYEEIHQVFGEDDRPAEKSDLEKFPYLDQVIKESQRLLTLVPVGLRQTQTDTKIGPHIYPAGTTIMMNFSRVHHDPKLYPDPYRFNPDNFSSAAIKNRHRCSFLAFSAGARNCIGKTLAEMSVKMIVIMFLRTFTFHTTKNLDNLKLKPGLVESVAFGYPMSITLRKKSL